MTSTRPGRTCCHHAEFSIRFPKSRIPAIVELLSEVSDEEYFSCELSVARYWRAFVWDKDVEGMASLCYVAYT